MGVRVLIIGSSWVGHVDPSGNSDYLKWLIEWSWPAIYCYFTLVKVATLITVSSPAAGATAYHDFYSPDNGSATANKDSSKEDFIVLIKLKIQSLGWKFVSLDN